MKNRRKQKGLSLIELLVAILISSVLLIAVMNLYLGLGNSSREQAELSTVQDKANFALNELSRQVRMAGAGLCSKMENVNILPSFSDKAVNAYADMSLIKNDLDSFNKMRLHSYSNPTQANLGTSLDLKANSDALMVAYTSTNALQMTPVVNNKLGFVDADYKLSGPLSTLFEGKDISNGIHHVWLTASSCKETPWVVIAYVDAFSEKELSGSVLSKNLFGRFGLPPKETGFLGSLEAKIFFVASGSDGLALYEKDLLSLPTDPQGGLVELMDGVSSLSIEYLEEDGAGKHTWKNTASRVDWSKLVPVKITLTMSEDDENASREFSRIVYPRN